MEKGRKQDRDDRNGRYTFDGDMSRLCVCGHTLGQHAAGAPRECFTHTHRVGSPEHADCDCPKFRLPRKQRPTSARQ